MSKLHKMADPHFHGRRTNRDYAGDALASPHVMSVPKPAPKTRVHAGVARMLESARGGDELSVPRVAVGLDPGRPIAPSRGPSAPSDPLAVAHVDRRLAKPEKDKSDEDEKSTSDEGDEDHEDTCDDAPAKTKGKGDKEGERESDDEEGDDEDDEDASDDEKTKRAVSKAFAAMRAAKPGTPARAKAAAQLRAAMGRA